MGSHSFRVGQFCLLAGIDIEKKNLKVLRTQICAVKTAIVVGRGNVTSVAG